MLWIGRQTPKNAWPNTSSPRDLWPWFGGFCFAIFILNTTPLYLLVANNNIGVAQRMRRKVFSVFVGVCSLLLPLVSPATPQARAETSETSWQPQRIVLSEINWGGSSTSTADEWLEIANISNADVDVSGWMLSGVAAGGTSLFLPDSTVIEPYGTLLVSNYPAYDGKTTLAVEPQIITASVSLSNSDMNILLSDTQGTVIDSVVDAGALSFGSSSPHASMERSLDDYSWFTATTTANLLDVTQLGTPGIAAFPVASGDVSVSDSAASSSCSCNASNSVETDTDPLPETTGAEQAVTTSSNVTSTTTTTSTASDNSTSTTSTAPAHYATGVVIINEFMSRPSSGDEWVELYNTTSASIALDGWTIEDASGKAIALSGTLPSYEFGVASHASGYLNNEGDSIILIDPSGNTIDMIVYGTDAIGAPQAGMTSSRYNGGLWEADTSPTPYATNTISSSSSTTQNEESTPENVSANTPPEDPSYTQDSPDQTQPDDAEVATEEPSQSPITNVVALRAEYLNQRAQQLREQETADKESSAMLVEIDDVPALQEGDILQTTGTIVALPDVFGRQIMFLDGLEIYLHSSAWPALAEGDVVTVVGAVDDKDGNKRLKIQSANSLTPIDQAVVSPRDIQGVELDSSLHAYLVRLQGKITVKTSTELTLLADDGTNIKVRDASAGGSFAALGKGDTVEITGVVRSKDGVTRIYVRNATDIRTMGSEVIASSAQQSAPGHGRGGSPVLGGGILSGGVGALAWWYIRAKKFLG